MPMMGNFETMTLVELFQWASTNEKSGVLKVTRGKSISRFRFDGGTLRGMASNDPPYKLGQFLISRGKIDEDQLNRALQDQEQNPGRSLGRIFVEDGIASQEEIDRYCVAKAEESIFALMDPDDAMFEFDPEARTIPDMVRMDARVDDILMRAATRQDELARMRAVLSGEGAVLVRTEHEMHPETAASSMARRIYQAIDGKRTFAEILLHTRATEYTATRFIFEMLRRGIVRVLDVRELTPKPGSPAAARELARRLNEQGEHEMALDVLNAATKASPGDEELRLQTDAIESTFLETLYGSILPAGSVPVHAAVGKETDKQSALTSNELYLLELTEPAKWDVQALVRVSPLHEIDVIRSLKSLTEKGFVEIRMPEADAGAPQENLQDLFRDIDAVAAIDGSLERTFGPATEDDS